MGNSNKRLNDAQQQAFNAAKARLDRNSKFYAEDLESLRKHYSQKSARECSESLTRANSLKSGLTQKDRAMIDAGLNTLFVKPEIGALL